MNSVQLDIARMLQERDLSSDIFPHEAIASVQLKPAQMIGVQHSGSGPPAVPQSTSLTRGGWSNPCIETGSSSSGAKGTSSGVMVWGVGS
jgi:hypothetical protein